MKTQRWIRCWMSLIKRVFLMEYVWQRKWDNKDNSLLGEKCVAKALLLEGISEESRLLCENLRYCGG